MCHFFNGHNLLRLAGLAQDGESRGAGLDEPQLLLN